MERPELAAPTRGDELSGKDLEPEAPGGGTGGFRGAVLGTVIDDENAEIGGLGLEGTQGAADARGLIAGWDQDGDVVEGARIAGSGLEMLASAPWAPGGQQNTQPHDRTRHGQPEPGHAGWSLGVGGEG